MTAAAGRGRNLLKRSAFAGGWKMLSTVLQLIAQMVVMVVLARHLTPAEYGVAALAQVAIGFGLMWTNAGFAVGLIQRSVVTRTHVRVAATVSLVLSTALAAVLALSAAPIAGFFKSAQLVEVLPWVVLTLPIVGMSAVSRAMLERDLSFKRLMTVDVGAYLIGYVPVGIGLAVMGYGVWAIVVANLVERTLTTVGLYVSRPYALAPSLSRKELGELAHFGAGLTLNRLFYFLGFQGDNMVVGRVLGDEALGTYSLAFRLMNLPVKSLGEVIDKVMFPAIAQVQDNLTKAALAYYGALSVSNFIMLPVAAVGACIAPEIVMVVLGPGWQAVVLPFQILLVAAPFRISMRMSDSLARALGRVYQSASRTVIYAVLMVVTTLVGALVAGLTGVAIGVAVTVAITWLMLAELSIRTLGGTWYSLAAAQAPALALSIIAVVAALPAALASRALSLPAWAIVAVTFGAAGGSVMLTIYARPGILGVPALSLLGRLAILAPAHLSRPLTRLLTRATSVTSLGG